MRRVATAAMVLFLGLVLVFSACAKPAPAPAPAPAQAPAPAPKPAPSAAPAPKVTPLQETIEGAKKEGTVYVQLSSTFGLGDTIKTLEKAIRDKYGVDLKINYTANSIMAATVATAIMETKTKAVPTYDLMRLTTVAIPAGMKEGAFARVDWKPLLEPGASPEMVLQHSDLRGGIVSESASYGLMYNPKKVSAAELPRKLGDLADPKWQGRFGLANYPADLAKWAFILGKDKTLLSLRAIMKNKPQLGLMPAINNLYLLGEIDVAFVTSTYLLVNRDKGMPPGWQALDFVDIKEYPMVVQTGSRNPSAAKLVAIYLASADGMKFGVERAGSGNHYYPGNYLYDNIMEAKKAGIPVYGTEYPGLLDFMLSPQYQAWQKEIELILRGAG